MDLREQLYHLCREFALSRQAGAREAIAAAQLSANTETKSSSGDKYETGRAMAQLEIENNSQQLADADNLLRMLDVIGKTATDVARPGSIVRTDQGNYYLSISAGLLAVDNESYYAVSPASPVGKLLIGVKKGDQLARNGKHFTVLGVE